MADEKSEEHPLPAGARRDSGIFLLLFAVTILLYFLSIPLIFGVIATGPAAAFFAIRAVYRSRKVPKVTSFRVGLLSGALVSFFALFTGLAMVIFYEPVAELQACNTRAITQTATDQCQRDYQNNIEQLMEDWLEQLGATP